MVCAEGGSGGYLAVWTAGGVVVGMDGMERVVGSGRCDGGERD